MSKIFITELIELNRLFCLDAPKSVTTTKMLGIIKKVKEDGNSFPHSIDFGDNNNVAHLAAAQGDWTAIITEDKIEFISI